jgi:hypothetical protein
VTRRIFLDVGANTGQSLKVAMRPEFAFDWIVCFEPAPQCWPHLLAASDNRVAPLYEPGRKGASMWAKEYARSSISEVCEFERASDWFREEIRPDDRVWLKLNAEGAECAILEDLLSSGEFAKVTHALIGWHGKKIPEVAERERALRDHLNDLERVSYAEYTTLPTWLLRACR